MSNGMQLISLSLFALSLLSLVGAVFFLVLWSRSCRRLSIVHRLRETIAHIGVSAVVEYPETLAPLMALLEEEYPRSEAVIITDLQHQHSPFGDILGQYHLIRVNHTHLDGVRALYRSRHRAFRRVVVVDLPTEYRKRAKEIGGLVASYDYVLHLQGESIVERDVIAYCADIIASQPHTNAISLQSIVGAAAHLENGRGEASRRVTRVRTDYALAWRNRRLIYAMVALLSPAAMVLVSYLLGSRLIFASAVVAMLAVGVFLYVSCRVVTEKGVFARLDTILRNFSRLLVERAKTFYYLYKGGWYQEDLFVKRAPILNKRQRRTNRDPL
jgi:hypothetical protein